MSVESLASPTGRTARRLKSISASDVWGGEARTGVVVMYGDKIEWVEWVEDVEAVELFDDMVRSR